MNKCMCHIKNLNIFKHLVSICVVLLCLLFTLEIKTDVSDFSPVIDYTVNDIANGYLLEDNDIDNAKWCSELVKDSDGTPVGVIFSLSE